MSKNKKDYYEVLQVAKTATEDEIKKAYRKLAKQYHPDVYKEKDAEARMREINEAYEVLSDPNKRQNYDQFGHNDPNMFGGGQGFGGFEDIFNNFGGAFGDFFGDMFGGGQRKRYQQTKGEDIFLKEKISLKEAILGKTINIVNNIKSPCTTCNQTGAASANDIVTCPNCSGTGQEIREVRTLFGAIQQQQTCSHCHGSGKIIKVKCQKCHGKKFIYEKETVKIDIPKGIFSGQTVRFQQKGHYGLPKQSRGDLLIEIIVQSHKYITRDGLDLILTMPVSFIDALMGGKVMVPTFEGIQELKIPAKTVSGDTFNIPRMGSYNVSNPAKRGNLKVKVEITFPKKLSKLQETLLQQLRDDLSFKPDKEFSDKF